MAKQKNNTDTTADGGEPVKGGGVNGGEETTAQKWAAAKKAELKKISDDENAAYKAEQAEKLAAEKERAGIVEDTVEEVDETDYSLHNTLGQRLKAKLAAAKDNAIKSISLEN